MDNGLRQAQDMIYDFCVRQKKCRSISKHVLKRCDNRKSCRRPVVSLSHETKIVRCKSALKGGTLIPRHYCLPKASSFGEQGTSTPMQVSDPVFQSLG